MFQSLAAVVVLVVFLVPGYVWRAVEGCLVSLQREAKWEMLALGLLTRSTIIYLPLLPFFYLLWLEKWHEQNPGRTCFLALLCLVVLPSLLGLFTGVAKQKRLVGRFLNLIGVPAFNSIPSAWESYFSQAPSSWMIVTLKNSQRVYGYFGPGSHASSDPTAHDIYLSHTVALTDGRFQLVGNTGGVYVPASEILTLEFIKEGEPAHEIQR